MTVRQIPGQALVTVKVHALLSMAAIKANQAMAYGLWCAARALDVHGCGRVALDDLRAAAFELGMSPHKFKRAMKQATAPAPTDDAPTAVLFSVHPGQIGQVVALNSLYRVSVAYRITHLGAYPVNVPAKRIIRAGVWKASLWAAFHASRGPQAGPISRAKLEEITHISPRTQRAYEAKTKVKRTPNFIVHGRGQVPSGMGAIVREYAGRDRRGSFDVGGQVWEQTASSYRAGRAYHRGHRGKCRRIQTALRGVLVCGAIGQPVARHRVFFDKRAAAEKALQGSEENGIPTAFQSRPMEVFYRPEPQYVVRDGKVRRLPGPQMKTASGANIWLSLT
jgi:hypothetical protein